LPGRAQAQKAVKIAYALRFANLADFVSWRSWAECGVSTGDLHKADYRAGRVIRPGFSRMQPMA
jgi:hypothetical protein